MFGIFLRPTSNLAPSAALMTIILSSEINLQTMLINDDINDAITIQLFELNPSVFIKYINWIRACGDDSNVASKVVIYL